MVRVAFAEKGSLSSKEEGHWRVPSVVGLAVVCCGLPSVVGAPVQTPLSGLRLITMAQSPDAPTEVPLSGLRLMTMAQSLDALGRVP